MFFAMHSSIRFQYKYKSRREEKKNFDLNGIEFQVDGLKRSRAKLQKKFQDSNIVQAENSQNLYH